MTVAIQNNNPARHLESPLQQKHGLFNEDAEIAVLAAIIQESELVSEVRTALTPTSFARRMHQQLFATMLSLDDAHARIDPISLSNAMMVRHNLEPEKGSEARVYIGFLIDAIPTTVNTPYYVRLVKECESRRQLAGVLNQAVHAVSVEGMNAREAAQLVFSKLLPIATEADGAGYQHVKDILWATMEEIESRRNGQRGLMTGYPSIDRETNGWRPGEFIVIGGAEKLGKSAIALNIGMRVARQTPAVGVAYVSAEMTAATLVERILSGSTGISSKHLASGNLSDADFPNLARWAGEIGHYPFWIDDEAEPTLEDVVARATHLKAQHPEVGLIIVDFMQLVQAHEKGQPESRELKRVAYGLKGLAKRTKTVVLAPCQINTKEVEDLKDMRPRLKDLQGSSGMRQAADFIGLAYREGLYNETAANADELEIFFAACRRTPKFMARFYWEGETLTIRDKRA